MTDAEHDSILFAMELLKLAGKIRGRNIDGREYIIREYEDVIDYGLTVRTLGESNSKEALLEVFDKQQKKFLSVALYDNEPRRITEIDESDVAWIGVLQICYEVELAARDGNDTLSGDETAMVLVGAIAMIGTNGMRFRTVTEQGKTYQELRYSSPVCDLVCRSRGTWNSVDTVLQVVYEGRVVFEATYHDGSLRDVVKAEKGEWYKRFLLAYEVAMY